MRFAKSDASPLVSFPRAPIAVTWRPPSSSILTVALDIFICVVGALSEFRVRRMVLPP